MLAVGCSTDSSLVTGSSSQRSAKDETVASYTAAVGADRRVPVCYAGQKLPQLDLNDLRHCSDWWLVVGSDTSGTHILP